MGKKASEKKNKRELLRKKIQQVTSTPAFNVSLLVLLILLAFTGSRLLFRAKTPAQIDFVENSRSDLQNGRGNTDQRLTKSEIFSGEVYSTAIRLRETGALGMAISLVIFSEFSTKNQIPENPERILSELRNRELMPPGVFCKDGELSSEGSFFFFHYQMKPLRFEVLSFPKFRGSGPALILRFPLNSMDGKTISFFQSSDIQDFSRPEPFAPLQTLVSSGWTIEQWKGEILQKPNQPLHILEEEKSMWDQLKSLDR